MPGAWRTVTYQRQRPEDVNRATPVISFFFDYEEAAILAVNLARETTPDQDRISG